ncbi:TetR/AcrR family transcriptional regulator [Candidatus Formimonas warabiya]|uniref:HTH tetR-type domain-containing protein n=1 Tax=Formimonas warabiya TaxID=1761012 RepID=A0A3G1KQS4_FORW1|nr:TetR/AcrR family transcriptional regulator [Candidatus Formimonas warabiya]ATW24808.1 hypothetical protein DCMF_08500 [Candidatus Formimonas warabiya]
MTKDRIKQEALILFVHKGYEGTSVAEIAKQANIRASTIYAHFESKEQLFLSLFDDVVNEKLKDLAELKNRVENKGIKELLQTILHNHLEEIEHHRDQAVFYKRNAIFPPENLKDKTQAILIFYEERYSQLLRPAFAQGVKEGILRNDPIEKLQTAFYCFADGLYVLSHYYDLSTYKKAVHDTWELFWESIRNKQG